MEAYFMGIDTGTQGVRIGISDTRGKLIFEKEQKWETEFPKVGWAEGCKGEADPECTGSVYQDV